MRLTTEHFIKVAEAPLDDTIVDMRKHRVPSKMKREMRRKYAKRSKKSSV